MNASRTNGADPWARLVLVAGHPRGGTTWLGALIGAATDAPYIFEPLTHRRHPTGPYADRVQALIDYPQWALTPADRTRDPALDDLADDLRAHVRWLASTYFAEQRGYTLIVKSPDTERLPWLMDALGARVAVYLRRHPMAVVNSYDAADLYRGWNVRREWALFVDQVGTLLPTIAGWARRARGRPLHRVLAMAVARDHLVASLQHDFPVHVVDFEAVAAAPARELESIAEALDLRILADLAERIAPITEPDRPRPGFLSIEKRSRERVDAWIRELPPWTQWSLRRYLEDLPGGEVTHDATPRARDAISGTWRYLRRRVTRIFNRALAVGSTATRWARGRGVARRASGDRGLGDG